MNVLLVTSPAFAQKTLKASEAIHHIGARATVCGKVADTRYARSIRGEPTFINLEKPYPNQVLTVVIWGRNRSKFENPEVLFRGKDICVSGRIESYRGIPQIEVVNVGQIIAGSSQSSPVWRNVTRVIDGDTIIVDGNERVRLIGVDTPETVDPRKPVQYFGREASTFTRRMVLSKRVRLEYDKTRIDLYGRTLAYVYLEDGTFLNAEIIKQGYGFAYTRFPFRYIEEFRGYEREAREVKRGLWKPES